MKTLSIIIPEKNEKYLDKTVADVLSKAVGEVEVLVYHDTNESNGMREGINTKVKEAKGEYILKLDAHCMLDEGFDIKLIEAHKSNWVQIPRRKRLNADKWELIEDGRPPVDYEAIIFQNLFENAGRLKSKGFIWASPWDDLTKERSDILVDDIPHFQGSCWFMTKEWFNECGFMSLDYGGFAQEAEEITFTTFSKGGEIKVNKNTWYAHLHKDMEDRRWFKLDSEDMAKGYSHSYNTWVRDKELFIKFIERFPLMPGWPVNWRKILY